MAGIALKGQADLISIMVPLEKLAKALTKIKEKRKKQRKYCSCYQYENGLCDGNMVGRDEEGS